MPNDRPTASITGQHGWEWNRWRANHRSAETSTEGSDESASGHSKSSRSAHNSIKGVGSSRKIRSLEIELTRKERHLQYVITHYEGLLAKKNRELNKRTQLNPESDGIVGTLTNLLRK